MKRWGILIVSLMMVIVLGACGNDINEQSDEGETEKDVAIEVDSDIQPEKDKEVAVELKDSDGVTVGTAVLEQKEVGVSVAIEATHLPAGTHGFHFHEKGVCEGPDFKSAGGHFNPEDSNHGHDHSEGPHAGDLPNVEVKEDGTVKEEFIAEMVTLEKGAENSLFNKEGTALVIHAEADDGISQPAGDAGARIVCGVISK